MERFGLMKEVFIVFVVCTATAIASPAQTPTTLHNFTGGADGANPNTGLIEGTDGNFYGTTVLGGTSSSCSGGCGTVFKLTPAGVLTTLYNFCSQANCADGANPDAVLIEGTDGDFYGTTEAGGAASSDCSGGCGTVFKITPIGVFTTLHRFCSKPNCADGVQNAVLIHASDGNLYGATAGGGAASGNCEAGCGTVYRLTPAGVFTLLHSFDLTDGNGPSVMLQGTDGNFYGATGAGGTPSSTCFDYTGEQGCGTVFRITPAGVLTTLHSFCSQTNCADGFAPAPLIQDANGDFYGAAEGGGTFGYGMLFRITPAGVFTSLDSFDLTDGSGLADLGMQQGVDGNIYGTTVLGGTSSSCSGGCGTVFKLTPAGVFTSLDSFDLTDGSGPFGLLVQAADGNFYGTTSMGGPRTSNCNTASRCGTLFEFTNGGGFDMLYNFCAQVNCVDGANPNTGLIQATDGNFYGTTSSGGAYNKGTIFSWRVAVGGTLSPNPLNFYNQVIDTTSEVRGVTVTNTGSVMLEFSSISPSANFAISSTTCGAPLVVGKHCFVYVTFTPPALGELTGTLTFADNALDSPQTVALSGWGVEPVTLPSNADYPRQVVGTTSPPKAFTLRNHLNVTLSNIVISTTGDFAVSTTTCAATLAARGNCTISVTFTPTTLGTRTGQLSVNNSARNSPQTSKLTGVGK
jgi:uncharacterized repeat protein (TIGR03803 family)